MVFFIGNADFCEFNLDVKKVISIFIQNIIPINI